MRACLVLLALVLLGVHPASFYDSRSPVHTLDSEAFSSQNPNEISVVHFYSPSCLKCQQMKGEFEKAAKQVNGLATFVAVNIDQPEEATFFADNFGVETHHSIKVFKGDEVMDYDGDVKAKALVAFVHSIVDTQVSALSKKAHKKWIKAHDHTMPKVLLFTKGSEPDIDPIYDLLSMKLKDRMAFGRVSKKDKKVVKTYGITDYPSLLVLPAWDGDEDFDAPVRVYSGKMKPFALSSFLELYALSPEEGHTSALPELQDQSCFEALCTERGGLCAIAVLSTYDQPQLHYDLRALRHSELNRRDKLYSFTWVDSEKQMQWLEDAFGVTPQPYAQVLVYSPAKKRFTVFVGSFNSEDVSAFLAKVHKGTISTDPIYSDGMPALQGDSQACEGMAKDDSFTSSRSPPPEEAQAQGAPHQIKRLPRHRGKQGKLYDATGSFDSIADTYGSWMVLFAENSEDNQALIASFKKAAKATKNMVTLAHWDLSADSRHAMLETLSVTDGTIITFKAGTNKNAAWDIYTGKTDAKSLNKHALSLLNDELVTYVQTDQDLQIWLSRQPLQPKIMLVTEKPQAPKLLCALADEFDEIAMVGFTHPDANLAQQFGVNESPALLFLQGQVGEQIEGTNQHQVGIQAQAFPAEQLYFNAIAMQLDVLRTAYPSSRQGHVHDEL